jgi:hypothetical protein
VDSIVFESVFWSVLSVAKANDESNRVAASDYPCQIRLFGHFG